MLFGETADVVLRLRDCLLDQGLPGSLPVPGSEPAGQRSIVRDRKNCDLTVPAGLAVILSHRGFTRGEFTLDLSALITGCAGKVLLRVVQFIGVELQLGLGDIKIGVVG